MSDRLHSMAKHGQSPMTASPLDSKSDPKSDPRSDPRWQSMTGSPLDPSLVINQTGESCSCKYYNFV